MIFKKENLNLLSNIYVKKYYCIAALLFSCFFSIISLIIFFSPKNAEAKSVADSMNGFWNDIGGTSSNTTEAGGYQLQGAGYYTGGSFTARSKVINVNPISITPPGIRAGCGGIDVYTGAFSHINTDQFVALLKAIPSNAVGFAFQLALATLTPEIKTTMDQLQSIIDRVNNTNLNSCDMAQGLVGGAMAAAGKTEAYCKTTANSQGWATDYAKAAADCKTGGRSSQYIKDADAVHGDQRPVNVNIAWEVLKKSQILADNQDELAQFVQAITGTMIIKSPENDNLGSQTSYKPSIVFNNDTIKAILEGGSVTILKCDERDKCLNPTETTITIATDKAFKARISSVMGEMVSRIATGQKFDAKHIDLVNKTSIPVHKAMVVRQAYFGSSSAASGINPEYYSALVAIDMLYNYLDEILKSVQEQAKQVKNFDQDNIERFQKDVERVRTVLSKYKIDDRDSFEKGYKIIEETQKLQGMLTSRMSNRMKNNMAFSSKF
jgi:conjugative transfer pilus assembly protein TraH